LLSVMNEEERKFCADPRGGKSGRASAAKHRAVPQ
jgi:hypothetical protein